MTTWLRLCPDGEVTKVQVDKSSLISELGMQPRDFRVMENRASRKVYCILSRERCIFVHLGYIRCLITPEHVLLIPPDDDRSATFFARLKERIQQPVEAHFMRHSRMIRSKTLGDLKTGREYQLGLEADLALPFELKALEICLDELALDIDHRVSALDLTIRAVADRLANTVRNESLELMRGLKGRIVSLTTAAAMTSGALEQLLGDDKIMLGLAMTWREERSLARLTRPNFQSRVMESRLGSVLHQQSSALLQMPSTASLGLAKNSFISENVPLNSEYISKVELLLEAYFLSFDSMLHKLQDIAESITGTVAMINIKLDGHQNKLLGVNVMCSGIAAINYLAVGIGGFLTMNLMPGGQVLANWAGGGGVIEGGGEPQLPMFLSYVIPAVVGSYIIFIVLLVVYFRRGIMQFG